ncbi:MAG: DUF1553 domain-containing protein [Planctomycetales bacterium]|nr:DUF1553 domain-containing protein [Planctomycetales bacterium]
MSRLRSSLCSCSAIVVAILGFGSTHAVFANPAVTSERSSDVEVLRDFKLSIEACSTDRIAAISGRDGVLQLVVTAEATDGTQTDITRAATYAVEPAGILQIDSTGLATPIDEGTAVIHASLNGQSDSIRVEVNHIENDLPINFTNDVVPLFTKHGCNGGGCHGKASGQNGFKLSLLGFEPREDYEFLIKEGRGRRLFPAAPDRSLLLEKAIGKVPHGGGARLEFDSPPYRVLRRWVSQGMPFGSDNDPKVVGIEVFPKTRTMTPGAAQQLIVTATYDDGSVRDVTRMTRLNSNDNEMAEVTPAGLVETRKQTGTVAVMAIFAGRVDVFRATLPLGAEIEELPEEKGFVDQLVFKQLKELGLPPSQICDDATFLRRTTIAIAGRLPTLEEATSFADDQNIDKREALIDSLLDTPEYADNFATKWSAVLRNKRENNDDKRATFAFYRWIRDSLYDNKPYDEFVREIITASGDVSVYPPVAWYRQVRDKSALVEDTAQLFLGLRIQCAKCHHHPFEKWSQEDYHSFSAFYAQIGRKPTQFQKQERIVHQFGKASAKNPKTGKDLLPTGLDAEPLDLIPDEDPRHALADWMTDPENPFFARALVNRYWKHFFGRGLIDPEDDMRVTNPASNPELLDTLAQHFVDTGFDMKDLVRAICNSSTFQLAADPNEYNQKDKQNFSRFYPKRLDAEILLDAIDQVTGVPTNFDGVPVGTRAIELPDNGFNSYFLTVFGRPESSSACECERSGDASLAQSLHLLNSKDILGKVSSDAGNAKRLDDDSRPIEQRIEELYLLAFARKPNDEEIKIAREHTQTREKTRDGFEDVVWALINTKEFLFNH